jgi:large subunit ribosomal protein L5
VARLQEKYDKDVAPRLAKEFGIANPMAVPRITKVVCNIGLGEAPRNAKLLDQAVEG